MMSFSTSQTGIDVILATSLEHEKIQLIEILKEKAYPFRIHCPDSLGELDEVTTGYDVKLIITDLDFGSGSLVDWLVLWPYPFILLVDQEDSAKIDNIISDESSSFLLRRKDASHLNYLPNMIKKVLNIRESLERHNNFLKISEKQYMNLVQALPDIIYVLDEDGNFTFINNAVRVLGWEPVELIGRHFSEILFQDDIPKVSRDELLPTLRGMITGDDRAPKLFDERRTGTRMTRGLKLRLRRKPTIGGSIDVSLTAYGEVSSIGYSGFQQSLNGMGTAGIIRENRSFTNSAEAAAEAQSIFDSKGALSHDAVMHLINNKLQIMSSLISLKQGMCVDSSDGATLNEVQIQIYTLSLVYQNMVTIDGKVRIGMRTYLEDIIRHLMSSYAGNPLVQQIQVHGDDINLDEDRAISTALLINEIISIILKIQNSFETGCVPTTITFLRNNRIAQLKIRTSEKVMNRYRDLGGIDCSKLIIQTLAETLKGEIFLDNDSITIFFNID